MKWLPLLVSAERNSYDSYKSYLASFNKSKVDEINKSKSHFKNVASNTVNQHVGNNCG